MSRCNHSEARLTINIERELQGSVTDIGAVAIAYDVPIRIRVSVWCDDCGYSNVETTYSNNINGMWTRWPKWLKGRLDIMRRVSKPLDDALTALKFDA